MNLKSIIIHPILFAIFPIMFLFTNNLDLLDFDELVLPLFSAGVFSFIFWIILGKILKNYRKSGIITTIFFVLIFSYGHLSISLDDTIANNVERNIFLGISYLLIFSISTYFFIKTQRNLKNITTIANVIAITLLSTTLINFINVDTSFQNLPEDEEIINLVPNEIKDKIKPDIYYIILDAHADLQILKNIYDFDNTPFIEYLETNEFFIPQTSFSNYALTFLSLSSSLNMDYVNEKIPIKNKSVDRSTLYQMIDENKIMKFLKSRGYVAFNFNSGWGPTISIKEADVNMCMKDRFSDSPFIGMIIKTSILNPVYVKFFELDNRERILCTFSEIPKVALQIDAPVFVFAHLLIPHAPFIFGPNGEEVSAETLEMGIESWENKKGYLDQVIFGDKKIKKVIEEIINKSETPPIIIIQADHGSGHTMIWGNPDQNMLMERHRILNAYYFPLGGEEVLYEGITPVNTFRQLFNYYFDEKYELLEDTIYFSRYKTPYDFKDITNQLTEN